MSLNSDPWLCALYRIFSLREKRASLHSTKDWAATSAFVTKILCSRAAHDKPEQVITGYKNEETRLIAEKGKVTKKVLRILPQELHEKARIKLAVLDAAESLEVLRIYPGLDLKTFGGLYQIRVNDT